MVRRFILFLAVFLGGCSHRATVSVPVPPSWVPPASSPATFSSSEVYRAIQYLAPGAAIETSDDTFTVVNHEWLEAMVSWSDAFLFATDHRYTPESFDCDKFAKAFTLGVEWAAGDAGVKAQPLVARIFVLQEHAFGNVPAGGQHALIAFRSNRGYFILEPQGGVATPAFLRLTPLSDYHNPIIRVRIGG